MGFSFVVLGAFVCSAVVIGFRALFEDLWGLAPIKMFLALRKLPGGLGRLD